MVKKNIDLHTKKHIALIAHDHKNGDLLARANIYKNELENDRL